MKPSDDDSGYVYNTNLPWRYSGLSARFLGLDPWIVLAIPLGILGLRNQWGFGFLIVLGAFIGMFVYVSIKGYPSVTDFLKAQSVRFIGRRKWDTR